MLETIFGKGDEELIKIALTHPSYTKENKYHIDSIKLDKVIDTTGAGDTFAATFLSEYLKNNDINSSLRIANYAAARACLFEGGLGGVTSIEELQEFIKYNNI